MIEAVIGIFLLTLGYISISNLFFETGFHSMVKARDYSIALNICERFLNSAQAKILLSQTPHLGETDLLPGIKSSETLRQSLDGMETKSNLAVKQIISGSPGSDRMYLVTVRMSWSDNPVEMVSLSTLVSRPEYSRN